MKPEIVLLQWLQDNGVKRCEFASLMDVDRSTVTLWVQGRRRPWRKHAAKIAEATGGAIPAQIWEQAA